MPELDFSIEDVRAERFAVTPTLAFGLRIEAHGQAIRNLALNCQIRIEPGRRGYGPGDHERLSELFGDKRRWGSTLRSFLWGHVNLFVPAFEGETRVALPMTCSHDFDVAMTKYAEGLEDGVVPLTVLFSGAIFYDDAEGRLQIDQIGWTKQAAFDLPVQAWRGLMAQYYPEARWLRVRHDLFERLARYKRRKGFLALDEALGSLLPDEAKEAQP